MERGVRTETLVGVDGRLLTAASAGAWASTPAIADFPSSTVRPWLRVVEQRLPFVVPGGEVNVEPDPPSSLNGLAMKVASLSS